MSDDGMDAMDRLGLRPRYGGVPLLAREPGGEMVPARAVADDALNGLKQKQEDRERRRKRMNTPYAEVIPGTRRQEKQR
jgi:hypothetical protein